MVPGRRSNGGSKKKANERRGSEIADSEAFGGGKQKTKQFAGGRWKRATEDEVAQREGRDERGSLEYLSGRLACVTKRSGGARRKVVADEKGAGKNRKCGGLGMRRKRTGGPSTNTGGKGRHFE